MGTHPVLNLPVPSAAEAGMEVRCCGAVTTLLGMSLGSGWAGMATASSYWSPVGAGLESTRDIASSPMLLGRTLGAPISAPRRDSQGRKDGGCSVQEP